LFRRQTLSRAVTVIERRMQRVDIRPHDRGVAAHRPHGLFSRAQGGGRRVGVGLRRRRVLVTS